MAEATQAYQRMKTVLTSLKVTTITSMRDLRCDIEPLLLYGFKTWILTTTETSKPSLQVNLDVVP